jgi:6-phosphofructokinase 1
VDRSAEVLKNIKQLELDAVVACGGEDTLGVAARLAQQGVPVVGVPKTIDKDLAATDYTLGFDTALRNVSEIIERSRTPWPARMVGPDRGSWVMPVLRLVERRRTSLPFGQSIPARTSLSAVEERLGEPSRGLSAAGASLFHVLVAEGPVRKAEIVTLSGGHDAFGHVHPPGGIGSAIAK